MTHQPPVPKAGTSPYPLHSVPIQEETRSATAAAEATTQSQSQNAERKRELGTVTALGVGAAVAVAIGLLIFRRSPAKSKAVRVPTAKRKRGGDDKSKRGKAERARVAADEPYEVTYFARKHRITAAEARAIIKKAGSSRATANALAARRTKV